MMAKLYENMYVLLQRKFQVHWNTATMEEEWMQGSAAQEAIAALNDEKQRLLAQIELAEGELEARRQEKQKKTTRLQELREKLANNAKRKEDKAEYGEKAFKK